MKRLSHSIVHTSRYTARQREIAILQEDLLQFSNSYFTREDNLFLLRVQLMQIVDKYYNNYRGENQINLKQLQLIISKFEAQRSEFEDSLIKKYDDVNFELSKEKLSVYKLCSKLCKINSLFLAKIQLYFPRLYDVISQEIYALNNQFKTELYGLLNTEGQYLGVILHYIAEKSRIKLNKEINKLLSWQQSYAQLIDKYNYQKCDKTNKNEKFYTDKYVCGNESIEYILFLQNKYLLKLKVDCDEIKKHSKSPYDILYLDESSKTASSPLNSFSQYKGSESILEILIQNFDKTINEYLSYNKSVFHKIKIFREKIDKFNEIQKQIQSVQQLKKQNHEKSNIFSNNVNMFSKTATQNKSNSFLPNILLDIPSKQHYYQLNQNLISPRIRSKQNSIKSLEYQPSENSFLLNNLINNSISHMNNSNNNNLRDNDFYKDEYLIKDKILGSEIDDSQIHQQPQFQQHQPLIRVHSQSSSCKPSQFQSYQRSQQQPQYIPKQGISIIDSFDITNKKCGKTPNLLMTISRSSYSKQPTPLSATNTHLSPIQQPHIITTPINQNNNIIITQKNNPNTTQHQNNNQVESKPNVQIQQKISGHKTMQQQQQQFNIKRLKKNSYSQPKLNVNRKSIDTDFIKTPVTSFKNFILYPTKPKSEISLEGRVQLIQLNSNNNNNNNKQN